MDCPTLGNLNLAAYPSHFLFLCHRHPGGCGTKNAFPCYWTRSLLHQSRRFFNILDTRWLFSFETMRESYGTDGRDPFLDLLKGIGILGVVAGHCGVFGNFFYVFHVPLFFFLSGITYRDSSSLPFRCWLWPELKKLLRRLWLPFVLFNGLFLLGHNLFFRLGWYSSSLSFREYPERIFRILTFGGGEQLLGALWFLIVLWELSLLFRLLLQGIAFLPRQFRLPLLLLLILLGCYVGARTTLPRSFHRTLCEFCKIV